MLSDLEHTPRFGVTVAGLGFGGGLADQHGPRGIFGVDVIALAATALRVLR